MNVIHLNWSLNKSKYLWCTITLFHETSWFHSENSRKKGIKAAVSAEGCKNKIKASFYQAASRATKKIKMWTGSYIRC